MNVGKKGLDLIKSFEGLELKAYKDSVGVTTIGYGHTRTAKMGQAITEAQAEALLRSDLAWVEAAVNKLAKNPSQDQFDAMVSFVFNLGETNFAKSTLLKKHNAGDFKGAKAEFIRWNKAGGKVLKGLTRRREAEAALYNDFD
jgi:lysozyme